MRIAGAAVLAAAFVAPMPLGSAPRANAQAAQPPGGVPTRCWVELPDGGAMVIPDADTLEACETAANLCVGGDPRAIVHHSNQTRLIQSDEVRACALAGR